MNSDCVKHGLLRALGWLMAALYVAVLLGTTHDLGYARDEGFYFQAAAQYEAWFRLLFEAPSDALSSTVIDRYWGVNHEHPAFVKTLFALSHWLFFDKLGWFTEEGTAYRFVGMLFSGVALGTVYAWGRQLAGAFAGCAALLALALMPRVFFHSHLSCFDVPVATLWLVTAFAYFRALEDERWRWAIATGVAYGLLLGTKHNSWLLPPVLVLHFAITRYLGMSGKRATLKAARPLLCSALLGPLVFYASWPWIWHDTWRRLADYAAFHLYHDYYNMEFLGRTYYEPPMPRLYAWVMTLATVPATTLLLSAIGFATAARDFGQRWLVPRWRRARRDSIPSPRSSRRASGELLWGLCLFMGYAPWLSSTTPIFGGTKHWMTAYPFLGLFAGLGASWALARLHGALRAPRHRWVWSASLAGLLVSAPLVLTAQSHPYGLSAYTPIVGGAVGAATLGLNRTFWGYTTGSLADTIDDQAPGGATLYLHDTARASFAMMQRDRRIREDIRATLNIAESDYALYHHEPHMGRVEYQIWVAYGTHTPEALGCFQGVPVVWLYRRPP